MLTAAITFYVQKWKDILIPTMDYWLEKLMELAEMGKLNALIKEKNTNNFDSTWKPLLHFLLEVGRNETFILGFLLHICYRAG